MFKAIGADTLKLRRIKYANFNLKDEKLAEGEYRNLKLKEVRTLYSLINKK